jgi:hypothetical protein
VDAIGLGGFRVEHDIGAAVRAGGSQVLLAESLDLSLDGVTSLLLRTHIRQYIEIHHESLGIVRARPTETYQLLRKRDLVELHLVHTGLCAAREGSGRDESALHDGQRNIAKPQWNMQERMWCLMDKHR